MFAWEFNNTAAPFDNPDVRKAFSMATDRDTYISAVRGGVGHATTSWLPPGIPGYDASRGSAYAFDKDKAEQALKDAGFPNGEGLPEVTLTIADSQAGRLSAEFLQQQIEQNLGFRIEIEVLESATYEDHYLASDFQAVSWAAGAPTTPTRRTGCLSCSAPAPAATSTSTATRTSTPSWTRPPPSWTTISASSCTRTPRRYIIDEDMGVAPLYNRVRNCLLKPYVDGLTITGLDGNVTGDFFYNRVKILEH